MKYGLQDLIDMQHFQDLQDRLNEIYSFPSSIIDNEGNILTATGWQDICTRFHRKNKECEKACIQSDRYILSHLHEANPAVSYHCPHGLVDNATPIIIEGAHYGNFFTGQFFLEEPDMEFFKAQAGKYGFDEEAYLEAVRKVPIWTQEKLNSYLFFIKGLITVISESGLKKLREIEDRKRIEESEELHRTILRTAMDGFWSVDTSGRLLQVNDAYCRMSGYSEQELLLMNVRDLEAAGNPADTDDHIKKIIENGKHRFETQHRAKDGKIFDLEISAQFRTEGGGNITAFLRDITLRKRAEEDRERLQAQLAKAMEMARLGPWEYDVVNDLFAFNDHFYKIFGTTAKEVGGYTLSSREYARRFVHPEDISIVAEEVRKAIETTDPDFSRKLEHRMLYADGKVGYISVQFFIVKDSRGRTIKTYGVNQDITERKLSEELLKESERRWRNILISTPQIGVSLDPEARITFANTHLLQLTGWKEEEVLGKDWFDMFIPEDIREEIRIIFDTVMHSRDTVGFLSYENDILTRAGERRTVSWSNVLTKDAQGAVMDVTCLGIDLTERKKAEERLRESEARFREMADLLPQVVYEANAKGILTYANQQAFDLFGYTEEDLEKSLNIVQMLVPEDRERAEAAIGKILAGNPPETDNEYYALRKDGVSFPIMIYSSPVVREDRVAGLRGIIVDMTEHKREEEEKRKLHAQLLQAQKMESVGRLAGGVAHDFNNMLGIIIGNAELAAMQVDPDGPIDQRLQEIIKASRRSADIVRQLLAFARKQTIAPKILDLNETVDRMLKMLRRLIGEDIDLMWAPGKDVRRVSMDPSQINQVLANLVVNARDAISGVGKITIETSNAVLDERYCKSHEGSVPGEYVLLSVSDSGVGMTREIMDHLFDPFFTTKEVGKGTGLGLATVYGIMKQNNGFINVYSEPGQGTTFRLYFPRCAGESVSVQEKPAEIIPRGTETVLIAEDEAPLLDIARAALMNHGYTVLAARTPTIALSLANEHKGEIHLLLTDVVMPEMNGRQLTELLKKRHPDLKCLFMSGYTANVVAHHGVLDEGVNFIEKPFSPSFLSKKVREVLDGPKS
ncbi:MAG: PAS domain S-box protein [Desulfobacteraceae bacterium]|nr:MAG: PAS domain S-box protein [Desulfobacteraceae bacterium]